MGLFALEYSSEFVFRFINNYKQCMQLLGMLLFLFEEIPISPKLDLFCTNQYQSRNQRFRLRRNKLFLGRKAAEYYLLYFILLYYLYKLIFNNYFNLLPFNILFFAYKIIIIFSILDSCVV